MWHRFTKPLRTLILAALKNAQAQNRPSAGSEDLLAAVSQLPESSAAQILNRLNIPIASQSQSAAAPVNAISSETLQLIESACEESANLRDRHVGSDHLLLALVQSKRSIDASLSAITADQVRGEIRHLRKLGFDSDALAPSAAASERSAASAKSPNPFTILNPALIGDPYPLYDAIRQIAPVYRDPLVPLWVVTGYAEAAAVFRDPRFRSEPGSNPSSTSAAEMQSLPAGPVRADLCVIGNVLEKMLVFSASPSHGTTRPQFAQMFSSRTAGDLYARVQNIADRLIEDLAPRGRPRGQMDLIDDFACPLPLLVVAEMIGLPTENLTQLKAWSRVLVAMLAFTTTIRDDLDSRRAILDMRAHFDRLFEELRQTPNDSLLSKLITPRDGAPPIDLDVLFANCVLLLAAGHVTTTSVLGNAVQLLLQNPEVLRQLTDDPSLMQNAVEEFLRLHAPIHWTRRRATEDLQLGRQKIARDEVVFVSIGAANRDPAQFADPHRLDVTRKDAARHLTFSGGSHYCLGAALARIELQVGLTTLLRRLTNLRIQDGFSIAWNPGLTLRTFDHLPMTFDVR